MDFWLINGLVNDAVTPAPRQCDIHIKDGKIAEIGKYTAGEAVDAAGLQIFPGLVEAHCHLGVCGWGTRYDGSDCNERADCIYPELEIIDAFNPLDETLRLAVEAGVTCVGTGPGSSNVLGGTFAAIKTHGVCVDEMVVKRKVAMKCAFGENPKNTHKDKAINNRMTIAAKLRDTLFKAKDYMAKLDAAEKNGEKKPDFNFKLHALLPVLRKEIPLKAHCHQANDIFTAIRIAREFDLNLTIEHCTEGHLIAGHLAKAGYPLAVGPSMTHCSKPELRNKSISTAAVLHRAGCKVSIITDSSVTPQQHLALCAATAVKGGMDEFAALQAITINPAHHLGIADRVGSIEVGKDADFVICDKSVIDYTSKVKMVFIDGKKVY